MKWTPDEVSGAIVTGMVLILGVCIFIHDLYYWYQTRKLTKDLEGVLARTLQTRSFWRHRRRGTVYARLGVAEVQARTAVPEGRLLVVYADQSGKLWARPMTEFHDGRFEDLN